MKLLLTNLTILALSSVALAQDIPLLTQKMTNSFMYNPAVAGHSNGSLTYSFRRSFSQIQNAPQTNFFSYHSPIADHRFGAGVNLYQENVNFIKNTYVSGAFAYHLKIDQGNVISLGVSGEYNMMRLSGTTNSSSDDPDYMKLANGSLDDADFSFGMMYHNRFVKVGLSANRLATAWIKKEDDFILTNYYTAFVTGMIPFREGADMLEPYITYRQFAEKQNLLDIGLYYTYNDMIMVGASMRGQNTAGLSAGFRLNKKLLIGYTQEVFLGDIRSQVGSTNEFTLRYDFSPYSYKTNFSADYKNAMAYRKKTAAKMPPPRSPAQFHSQQKKLTKAPTPTKRYQGPAANHKKSKNVKRKPYNQRKR